MIGESPLCWIVPHAYPAAAILMPVVIETDDGRPTALLGHLPRRAPATAALANDAKATFLFLGPNAYISPEAAGRRDWAPTWNFVSASVTATVGLDPALTSSSVEAIVGQMEGDDGWNPSGLGDRYDVLLSRITGFRAHIDRLAPRFKLGQDEVEGVRNRLIAETAGTALGAWMSEFAGKR